eukprot:142928-Pyramimonas_sp.AAC.1
MLHFFSRTLSLLHIAIVHPSFHLTIARFTTQPPGTPAEVHASCSPPRQQRPQSPARCPRQSYLALAVWDASSG